MDKERQIRILYPPFLLLSSLLTGSYFDDKFEKLKTFLDIVPNDEIKNIILIILGGGVLVLVLGYIIGTITIVLLRALSYRNGGNYEINFKPDIYERIWEIIILNPKGATISQKENLYVIATYDHQFLPKDIHKWIQRRWNSFYTSANSAVSLIISILIVHPLKSTPGIYWTIILGILICVLIYHSYKSWRETMDMIEFQIKVKDKTSMV